MKKVTLLMAVVCQMLSYSLFSQVTTFEKLYGEISRASNLLDIEPTADGGYAAIGLTHAPSKSGEFNFIKYDAAGNEEITMNYGSEANEQGVAIGVLSDRYVLGGTRFNLDLGTRDCYLMTIDLDGNLLEEVVFGGIGEDGLNSIEILANGQIAVASFIEYDLPQGQNGNLRIYDEDLNLLVENVNEDGYFQNPEWLKEIPGTSDILVSGGSFLVRYSANFGNVNWFTSGNNNGEHVQFDDFTHGVQKDADTFVFTTYSSEDTDNHIFYVDINNGTITDFFAFNLFSFERPDDIAIVDNMAYVLLKQNDDNGIFPFDLNTETFGTNFTVFPEVFALTSKGDNKLVLTGAEVTADYGVAKTVQLEMSDNSEDWSTESGDFSASSISDFGYAISETTDGEMYLSGVLRTGTEQSVQVRKINRSGAVLWETVFGDTGKFEEVFASTTANDGGCLVPFYTVNDEGVEVLSFQKLSPNGNLEWSQTIDNGNQFFSTFGNVVASSDGSYFFAGTVFNPDGGFLGYVVKLAENGDLIWDNTYSVEDFTTRAYSLTEAANGDLIVAGYNDANVRQPILFRLNVDGDLLWANRYETTNLFSRFTGVKEAADGTIYAIGISTNTGFTQGKGVLFHVSADGNQLDGGIMTDNPEGTSPYDIVLKEDGTIHTLSLFNEQLDPSQTSVTSRTRSVLINKLSENYEVLDAESFGFGTAPIMYKMIAHSDGGLAGYGYIFRDNSSYGYLISIDAEGVSSTINIQSQGNLKLLPTVSDGNFSIDFKSQHTGDLSLKIYNTNGQIVQEMTDRKVGENWQMDLNLPELSGGNYFVNIRLGEFAWTQQMVKQ